MTAVAVGWPLALLRPVGLAELTECAALQTRVDRKYVLPIAAVPELLASVRSDARVLEIHGIRTFGYESVYFDTPQLTSYRSAACRRRRRFKVRVRTYLDSSLCWLEVKTRGARGLTVKDRVPYRSGQRLLVAAGRRFVDGVLARESIAATSLAPTLVTRYRRSTLYLSETASRVTVDTDLVWEGTGHRLHLPGHAVIETKTGAGACGMDRLLWARGYRPVRISKYATGLAALRPDLPATPWRRTLRRYFAAEGSSPVGSSPSTPPSVWSDAACVAWPY